MERPTAAGATDGDAGETSQMGTSEGEGMGNGVIVLEVVVKLDVGEMAVEDVEELSDVKLDVALDMYVDDVFNEEVELVGKIAEMELTVENVEVAGTVELVLISMIKVVEFRNGLILGSILAVVELRNRLSLVDLLNVVELCSGTALPAVGELVNVLDKTDDAFIAAKPELVLATILEVVELNHIVVVAGTVEVVPFRKAPVVA